MDSFEAYTLHQQHSLTQQEGRLLATKKAIYAITIMKTHRTRSVIRKNTQCRIDTYEQTMQRAIFEGTAENKSCRIPKQLWKHIHLSPREHSCYHKLLLSVCGHHEVHIMTLNTILRAQVPMDSTTSHDSLTYK